ncbi:MAG: hypothetical protein P8Y71_29205, partial [Pseudolabrys sp.]
LEMQPGSRSVIPFGAAARTEKIALQTRFFSILLEVIIDTYPCNASIESRRCVHRIYEQWTARAGGAREH